MSFFKDVNPHTVSQASDGFKEFKIGDNHAYISKVEEKPSNSGNPMLEITFCDDDGTSIKYWIVDGEFKLSRLKQLYAAFGIPMGETNTNKWIGKWGTVVCKAGEPYNNKIYNKVHFLRPATGNLPHGSQPEQSEQQSYGYSDSYASNDNFTDDIPF